MWSCSSPRQGWASFGSCFSAFSLVDSVESPHQSALISLRATSRFGFALKRPIDDPHAPRAQPVEDHVIAEKSSQRAIDRGEVGGLAWVKFKGGSGERGSIRVGSGRTKEIVEEG